MSMYNSIFGLNESAALILAVLDLNPKKVPRLRDAFFQMDGDEVVMVVHTRTGGGNRNEYHDANEELMDHPLYVRDEDDSYDSTYANFYFKFPEELRENLGIDADEKLRLIATATPMPRERWEQLLQDMKDKNETTDTARALELGKKIVPKLKAALDGTGSPIIET